MNRLILIEGIPGSGKSTLAKRLAEYYREKGDKVAMFNEGDLHPVDLAWCAYLTRAEYDTLYSRFPEFQDKLDEYSRVTDDDAVIAYTKLGFYPDENDLMAYCEAKEVFQGKVPYESFRDIHMKRWSDFSEKAGDDTVYIFECVYLQNHVTELLGTYEIQRDGIVSYMTDLMKMVAKLDPVLVYIEQDDIEETIDRVAKERVSPDKSKWKDWIELVIDYTDAFPYTKSRGQSGYEGAMQFFRDRKAVELEVLKALEQEGFKYMRNNNSHYDLNRLVDDTVAYLENI